MASSISELLPKLSVSTFGGVLDRSKASACTGPCNTDEDKEPCFERDSSPATARPLLLDVLKYKTRNML